MVRLLMETNGQPVDLRSLIGEDILFQLAKESAHRANLSCLEACTGIQCPHLCPPIMVPLLLYSYAAGICGSDEIERHCYSDKKINGLCGDKAPESARIRCFRRTHRKLVQQSLADLIRQARSLVVQHPETLAGAASSLPYEGFDLWTCEQEAERRLDLAVHADSMDLDQ